MNSPCPVTYLARMGEGVCTTKHRQHTVRLVHGPWQCHRMLHPASSSVCQHRWAPVPALLSTAALGGQFSSAVGPTVKLLSRNTQGGIFPLPLSSPVAPVQGTRLDTERNPGAGLAAQKVRALQQVMGNQPWTHNDGDWKLWVHPNQPLLRVWKLGTGNVFEPRKQCQEQNHRIMSGSFD